jgi:ABC-type multidrug transport system ATPase subunit
VTFDFDRVELAGVSRHFGRRHAVRGVSLVARRGDIVGLLGPNGAGKSTLIGMMATLVVPSSGTIRYGNLPAGQGGADIRAHIGLLAHELHLYSDLSARQNLDFFARLYGLDAATVVPAALELAGLADRGDDAVGGFSRGMRQRLGLERSLLHRPRLVLFDEPFTGLDDRAVTVVVDRLRRLSAGAIVILATHDLDLADGLVTRVAIVQNGRLIADEPASSSGLRHQYRALVGHAS